MLRNIDLIISLQSLDKDIFELEKKIEEIPFLLKKITDGNLLLENKFNLFKTNFLDKTKEKKDLESELSNIEKNIEKLNLELNTVKTNDRYRAILDSIKNYRVKKDKIEEKILFLLEDLDNINEEIKKLKEILDIKMKELEVEKVKMTELENDLKGKISSISQNREKLIKDINNNSFVDLYETIKKHDKKGIAIVKVNIEDGVCPSCNIKLPIQKINEIMTSTEPICCDNCSKIFYIL